MSQSILYYPTINIEDGTWLRSALLYWNEINSIVPHRDYHELSPELLYLQDLGLYKPIYPENILDLSNSDAFSKAIIRHFRSIHNQSKRSQSSQEQMEIFHPDLHSLIHYNKLPPEVLHIFTKNKIIDIDNTGWIRTDKIFAMQYMRLLADFAATHSAKDTVISTSRMRKIHQLYPTSLKKPECSAVSIVLEKCLPTPSTAVSFEDLIDFKRHNGDALLALRFKIRELEKSISEADNIVELKAIMSTFTEKWEYELESADRMFKGRGIKYTLGSLRSFILSASTIRSLTEFAKDNDILNLSPTAIGSAIGAAGLIGIGAHHLRSNQLNTIPNGNGFAYVISAQRAGLLSYRDNPEIIN